MAEVIELKAGKLRASLLELVDDFAAEQAIVILSKGDHIRIWFSPTTNQTEYVYQLALAHNELMKRLS